MSKKQKGDDLLAMRMVKSQEEQRLTWGVVYQAGIAPGKGADGFNDLAKAQTLEDACHRFMEAHQDVGLWHADGTSGSGRVIECSIHRGPPYVVKAADNSQVTVGTGDWLLAVRWQPQAWELIKSGAVTGYSFQGAAKRRRL
jgi:hypothetical protein